MTQTFAFQRSNSNQWESTTSNLNKYLFNVKKKFKGDFEVEIREIKKKRSGQQLKAYWVLIEAVRVWMNKKKQNCFTQTQISEFFKIQSGHCDFIPDFQVDWEEEKWVYVGRSIANKSDCTKEEMEDLINTILVFGAKNLIEECYIEDRDLEELLNYYK